ncbi:MAG: 6-phospho-3-hexuloisomerase [Methanomethylophilus sp.]
MEGVDYLQGRIGESLSRIPASDIEKLADSVLRAKRIFVFGAGRSGLVGQMFAVRLVQLGLHVYFVGDMTTPIIAKGDLVILVSNTGHTMSVTRTAEIAKRIGSEVAAVTGNRDCKLARLADFCIFIEPPKDNESAKKAPLGTAFEDSALIFFDCLVPELMERMGRSEADMRSNHAIWV